MAVQTFPSGGLERDILRFFDATSGELLTTINPPQQDVYGSRYYFNGTELLVLSGGTLSVWDTLTGQEIRSIALGINAGDLRNFAFSADTRLLATIDRNGVLRLWDTVSGTQRAFLENVASGSGLAFGADGAMLALSTPFQIITLADWTVHPIEQQVFTGAFVTFSLDNTSVLLGDSLSTMVFGIPNEVRHVWEPITANVVSSGISVRISPQRDAEVIGYASGEVQVSGREHGGNGVYLPDFGGWVWGDANYLDLGEHHLADLPILDDPSNR